MIHEYVYGHDGPSDTRTFGLSNSQTFWLQQVTTAESIGKHRQAFLGNELYLLSPPPTIGLMGTSRPFIMGPSTGPQATYPLQMEGKVISGFGRGSKELGIPTANLPVDDNVTPWNSTIESGVYFGWISLPLSPTHTNEPAPTSDTIATSTTTSTEEVHSGFSVYPMVMSIGYNPFYGNTVRSAEVHVLHEFGRDFYGVEMRVLIMGFIREERNYPEQQALIDDIKLDCKIARNSLAREAWSLLELGKGTLDGSWLVRERADESGVAVGRCDGE